MKEKIAGFLILILLFTAILPNYVYGDENEPMTYSYSSFQKLQDEGKADKKLGGTSLSQNVSFSFSGIAATAGIVGSILVAPVMAVQMMISYVANGATKVLTIQEIVFNECELLNANYTEQSTNRYNELIRTSVMKGFYAVRNLAIALSLIMLIYVGIRIAMASIASDKAKYKKMLIDWLVSFTIIFIIQYIIVIAMAMSDTILEFFSNMQVDSFESGLMSQVLNFINQTTGWAYISVVIMYIMMVYYEFKFFYIYIKRFFVIGFLILISPLITITYAADRAGDGKSQALNIWLREFLINIFIQPIHAAIYLVFIVSANEIFKVAPLLAVIFFSTLSRAEKIVKNILGLTKLTSMKNMEEEMKMK